MESQAPAVVRAESLLHGPEIRAAVQYSRERFRACARVPAPGPAAEGDHESDRAENASSENPGGLVPGEPDVGDFPADGSIAERQREEILTRAHPHISGLPLPRVFPELFAFPEAALPSLC